MREFIKLCAMLFVLIGAIVVVIPLGLFLQPLFSGGFSGDTFFGLGIVGLLAVPCGASIALIGGGTYMACSIDERLERMAKAATAQRQVESD